MGCRNVEIENQRVPLFAKQRTFNLAKINVESCNFFFSRNSRYFKK